MKDFTPDRRLRPAGRLQLGRARRPRRLDRLALPAALRQRRRLRPHARPRRRPLVDPPGRRRSRPSGATCPGTLVIETTFTTDTGTVRLHRRDGVRRRASAATSSASTRRTSCCAASRACRGEVELELELAPRPEYGLVQPLIRLEDGGARTFGGRTASPCAPACRSRSTDATMRASFTVAEGERVGLLAALGAGRAARARPSRRPPDDVAERIDDTAEAWRSWEAEHDIYEGPHRELVRHQLARAQGPHLPADRRDRRRADDLAARDGRRRAQLGLPLLLDPRLEPDDRGALHRRLLRRGRGVRLLHDELGRRPRRRGLAPDHVRDRRRARPLRARAAAPARLARLAPGARRQRRLGPDPARRLRRAAQLAVPLPRAARRAASRDPGVRRRPRRHRGPALDGDRLRACGRCAASRATTSPRRCCAGPRSTARSSSRRSSASYAKAEEWEAARDEIRAAILERGWSEKRRRTRSRSTPTSSTPRSC